MRTSNSYNRVILHFFFVLINFVNYFNLSIFIDLKLVLNILLASMKTTFFLLESMFCALSNEILHSLLL